MNDPVDLFHGLEGGEIAQQRPPPPGPDMPYPNVGSVPPRPAAPDLAAQGRLADQLAAQRDAALAAVAKSPVPVLPSATPAKPAAPPVAAAALAEPANKVVVAAADAPEKPASPAPKSAAALPGLADVPPVPAVVTAAGSAPALAGTPPPPPADVGLQIPPPAPPSPAVPPQVAPPPVSNTVQIAFTPGSAELPPSATLALRRFALAHKGVPLTVTGHGSAVLPGAESQTRALVLGLKRAKAIAASLEAAGVPPANLRLHAEAAGLGGSASL